ncbi:MAG TPA: aminomethyl-transferring glycine dehydrogenase subunit GcvPA [Deinococcales bacterium]|nr:aminomethyl-transferring glycine dehydrogenase subunit GcvPA [Deinococcales bacterium]
MKYTPHTEADITRALKRIGVDSIADLFTDIPPELLDPDIEIGAPQTEFEIMNHLRELAAKNRPASGFIGGGARKHFIPSVTGHLALQSEFVTSYTPYQPEVAQGVLQATFEYQTMISELTGLPVANASMYDGASATAEAALLAVRQTRRQHVTLSRGVDPQTREVVRTYLQAMDIEVATMELDGTVTDTSGELHAETACVIAQQPNCLGYLEDMPALGERAAEVGALFVAVADPLSLTVLEAPGNYGADVAVGDGQTIGNPLAYGGPAFGYMAVKQKLVRQLPGRLVGETVDADGKRAYVLTLQAREQHIRRSRAKSNICSNHQLTAIMAAVNMAAMGPEGLREQAAASVAATHDLARRLEAHGLKPERGNVFFNEFIVPLRRPAAEVRRELADRGVLAGVPVEEEHGNALLLTATEITTDSEREELARLLAEIEGVDA